METCEWKTKKVFKTFCLTIFISNTNEQFWEIKSELTWYKVLNVSAQPKLFLFYECHIFSFPQNLFYIMWQMKQNDIKACLYLLLWSAGVLSWMWSCVGLLSSGTTGNRFTFETLVCLFLWFYEIWFISRMLKLHCISCCRWEALNTDRNVSMTCVLINMWDYSVSCSVVCYTTAWATKCPLLLREPEEHSDMDARRRISWWDRLLCGVCHVSVPYCIVGENSMRAVQYVRIHSVRNS